MTINCRGFRAFRGRIRKKSGPFEGSGGETGRSIGVDRATGVGGKAHCCLASPRRAFGLYTPAIRVIALFTPFLTIECNTRLLHPHTCLFAALQVAASTSFTSHVLCHFDSLHLASTTDCNSIEHTLDPFRHLLFRQFK